MGAQRMVLWPNIGEGGLDLLSLWRIMPLFG